MNNFKASYCCGGFDLISSYDDKYIYFFADGIALYNTVFFLISASCRDAFRPEVGLSCGVSEGHSGRDQRLQRPLLITQSYLLILHLLQGTKLMLVAALEKKKKKKYVPTKYLYNTYLSCQTRTWRIQGEKKTFIS